MVFFFFLKSNNSFPSKQWKKKKWRWVQLWWERASLFLVLELLGPSFSGISAMRPLFPQIRLRCPFFSWGRSCWESILSAAWLVVLNLVLSCVFLGHLIPSVSSWVSHFSEGNWFPFGIAISTTLPHGYASRRFLPGKKRQESRTVRENGAGALVLPELWTNHPWPCSRGEV